MNTFYEEIASQIGNVLFASWYDKSRNEGIGIECHAQRNSSHSKAISMEIVPAGIDRYNRKGIHEDDIVALWVDDDMFIPIYFKDYNGFFDKCADDDCEHIETCMYNKLNDYIAERMKACGIN